VDALGRSDWGRNTFAEACLGCIAFRLKRPVMPDLYARTRGNKLCIYVQGLKTIMIPLLFIHTPRPRYAGNIWFSWSLTTSIGATSAPIQN
jgi:hypothetical protein